MLFMRTVSKVEKGFCVDYSTVSEMQRTNPKPMLVNPDVRRNLTDPVGGRRSQLSIWVQSTRCPRSVGFFIPSSRRIVFYGIGRAQYSIREGE